MTVFGKGVLPADSASFWERDDDGCDDILSVCHMPNAKWSQKSEGAPRSHWWTSIMLSKFRLRIRLWQTAPENLTDGVLMGLASYYIDTAHTPPRSFSTCGARPA
jgi:hypothetical protein